MQHASYGKNIETVCVHCHDDCGVSAVFHEGKAFCCEGCKVVFTLLAEQGLCPTDSAADEIISAIPLGNSVRYSYLDEASINAQLVDFHIDNRSRITFRIPAVHCASCIGLLERLPLYLQGILRSDVNFLRKEISIDFEPEALPLSHIAELLAKLGYPPEITLAGKTTRESSARPLYFKLGLAGFAFGNIMLFSVPAYFDTENIAEPRIMMLFGALNLLFGTPVLFYSAADWFKGAYRSLRQKALGLDVPIALGVAAIYLRSVFEILSGTGTGYMDSFTGLVFFLLLGKLAQKKTFDALNFERDYTSYFPLAVRVITGNIETTVAVSELRPGATIRVANSEVIPADSTLVSEFCYVDYSFVTGESAPVEMLKGSVVYAGGKILGNSAEFITNKEVSQGYLTRLWNTSAFRKKKKSALTRISDRFAVYFSAFTLTFAVAAAGFYVADPSAAISVFTAVVIIACPCALWLAAPFALGTAAGELGRRKFYVKEPSVVLDLTTADTIVFDKTGTLTTADTSEVSFIPAKPLSHFQQRLLASIMRESSHPLGKAVSATSLDIELLPLSDVEEIPGLGIRARVGDTTICCGSAAFVDAAATVDFSAVYCSVNGEFVGYFSVKHPYRNGLTTLFGRLRRRFSVYLLSGDNPKAAGELRPLFGNTESLHFNQTPQGKGDFVKNLQAQGKRVIMIGDGLNDAAALKQSDAGIAITSQTGAFTPACDVIASAETLGLLPDILAFTRYTKAVIIGVFFVTVMYNAIGLTLAATNSLSPLAAAILMPVSSLTVIACSTFTIRWGAKWTYFSS